MQSNPILTLTVVATAALIPCRFVTHLGELSPIEGSTALGVTRTVAAIGELVPVDVLGTAAVEAGAAVANGAVISCDATGRAITHASSARRLGRALQAAAGAGDRIEVLLFQA